MLTQWHARVRVLLVCAIFAVVGQTDVEHALATHHFGVA